jgi:hypothetical protein
MRSGEFPPPSFKAPKRSRRTWAFIAVKVPLALLLSGLIVVLGVRALPLARQVADQVFAWMIKNTGWPGVVVVAAEMTVLAMVICWSLIHAVESLIAT